MGKTFNASVDWLGMVENPDQDVNPSVNGEKAQTGIEFKAPKRDGERINSDGSESTHIMKTETIDGINWVSFPTLFQNEDGSWDNTYELMIKKNPDNWKPAMLEAKRRGELIHFGPNKKEALEYGKGSWKPKVQTGEEIIQKTLPEVEVSALTDESYNKLSDPQKQIYDSFVTPDGIAQTVNIGDDRVMHWKDALRMTDDLGVRNIYNKPSTVGQMFPSTFNVNDTDFRPHVNPALKNVYVPKLIEPGDPLYYNWATNMINDLKLGEQVWVKQMSEQERKNKIHRLRTTIEDAYRREYFEDIIAEYAHIPEFWRSESFYNIPKSLMNDAIRFFKGEEMDRARYKDKDHYEYKTHTGPDSFEEKLREKYKMKDGEEVIDPEREKWKTFAVKNESGYYYIRNKDSAVKKLDANGNWTGDYYKIYENGKYYPYYGNKEKTATIGHGHHPTHVDIFDTYKDGIDEDKALELLDIDLDEKLRLATHYYDKRYGKGEWDKLTSNEKFMLVDYEFNMGNNFGGYENYVDAIRTKDFDRALKEFKRKNNPGGGYMGRDASYLETYLQPWINIQKEKVAVAPPLDKTPLPIGVYRIDMSEPKKKETSWWKGEEGWIPDELEFWNYKTGGNTGHMSNYGKRWEEREQDSSAMPPQQTLDNTLTVDDNLSLDKTIKDLNGYKYGGQYKYGLDLRNTKLEQGDEVDDDIYSTKRYSHSAKKYKKMIPKFQSEGEADSRNLRSKVDGRKRVSTYTTPIPQTDDYILNAGWLPEVEVIAEDPRNWLQRNYQDYISPIGHGVLDVVGMVPGFGEPFDGLNALWYAGEGNYTDAALTSAAMIPFGGWAATTGKWTKNTIKSLNEATPGGGDMYLQMKRINEVGKNDVKTKAGYKFNRAKEIGIPQSDRKIKKMIKKDPDQAQKLIDEFNVKYASWYPQSMKTDAISSRANFLDNVKLRVSDDAISGLNYFGPRNNLTGIIPENILSYTSKLGDQGTTTLYRYGESPFNKSGLGNNFSKYEKSGWFSADPFDPFRYDDYRRLGDKGKVFKIDIDNRLLNEIYRGGPQQGSMFNAGTVFKEFDVPESLIYISDIKEIGNLTDYGKYLKTLKKYGGQK